MENHLKRPEVQDSRWSTGQDQKLESLSYNRDDNIIILPVNTGSLFHQGLGGL